MTTRQTSAWAAAAGVVAVGTGLALGELAAGLVSPSLSPVTAVGGAVIDVVPPGLKDWAISLFGTADKIALLGGMGLVIAALAAMAGIVELRRRFAGVAIIAVFGVAGLAAVLGRSELTGNAIPVPLLAAVVGMVLLRWLIRRLEDWQTDAGLPAGDTAPPAEDTAPAVGDAAAPADGTAPPAEHTAPAAQEPATSAQPASRRRFFQVLGGTAAVAAGPRVHAAPLPGGAAARGGLPPPRVRAPGRTRPPRPAPRRARRDVPGSRRRRE